MDDRLPKLPGISFDDRIKVKHHVPQCFGFRNGYRTTLAPARGIGNDQLKEDAIDFCSQEDPITYDPILTYGAASKPLVAPFRPHFVIYDKKVLKFTAFFKQCVPESPIEHYRTRFVNILYFLEDDTITVVEPIVENSGFPQGRLVRRGKIASSIGTFYTWKDFNIGNDISLNGIVFHITDCDPFSKDFLLANGMELNDAECLPNDPVTTKRLIDQANSKLSHITPSTDDKLRRFLEFTGKVLHFDCVLDETDRPGGELLTYKLYYYLEDDTIAIKELKENQEGRDHFPMMLKRTKLPKNWQRTPVNFPNICMEMSDAEVAEFYQPKDLFVGTTVYVFGRKFLLLDCDIFTRSYYEKVLKCPQPGKLEVKKPDLPEIKIRLPEYMGLGTPEDSLASCYRLRPKAPKKDLVTYLVNANKNLRYACELDTAYPEDKGRKFILIYCLSDGKICIMERSIVNSGIQGGKFLSSQKVPKPDCNINKPDYYTPKDFFIGAILKIFCHRFVIKSADLYVYRYMQAHPELFSPNTIDSVRNYHLREGNLKQDIEKAIRLDQEEYLLQQEKETKDLCEVEQNIRGFQMTGHQATLPIPDYTKRIPSPEIPEESLKKYYHDKEQPELPCNLTQTEDSIHAYHNTVRFEEDYEKKKVE